MCYRHDNLGQRCCVVGDAITPLCARESHGGPEFCARRITAGVALGCAGHRIPLQSLSKLLPEVPSRGRAASAAPGSGMRSSGGWSHRVPSTGMLKDVCQEEGVWFWQCRWAALSGSERPTGAAASGRASGSRWENHVLGRGVLTQLPKDAGTHSSEAESRHVTRMPRREGRGPVDTGGTGTWVR